MNEIKNNLSPTDENLFIISFILFCKTKEVLRKEFYLKVLLFLSYLIIVGFLLFGEIRFFAITHCTF